MNQPNRRPFLLICALLAGLLAADLEAQNPLAGRRPAVDPWLGSFSDGQLRLTLRADPTGYLAELNLDGQTYPGRAHQQDGSLSGQFEAGDETYAFSARWDGSSLLVHSGGDDYRLTREGAASLSPADPFPGAEVQAGRTYAGGEWVQHSQSGVAFRIPEGWIGQLPPEAAEFLMASNTQPGIGVLVCLPEVTKQEVVNFFREPKDLGDGVVLHLDGQVLEAAGRVSARYAQGQFKGVAAGRLSPFGNGLGVLFAGPADHLATYERLAEELAQSVRFAAPASAPAVASVANGASGGRLTGRSPFAQEWVDFLAGMMLKRLESYSSPGGSVGGGYSIENTVHLCATGNFLSSDASLVSAGNAGINGFNSSSGSARGTWDVEAESSDAATLVLTDTAGGVTRHQLTWDPESKRTYLNGNRVFRVQSDGCP